MDEKKRIEESMNYESEIVFFSRLFSQVCEVKRQHLIEMSQNNDYYENHHQPNGNNNESNYWIPRTKIEMSKGLWLLCEW